MLNFAVGPVMSSSDVLAVAHQSTPYFRTEAFSAVMLENERIMLELLHAPQNSRCIFLTASGTGAMESCVMNLLHEEDRVIVINGGSFGQRFVDLCALHNRRYTEVRCGFGSQIQAGQLAGLKNHTALLVNMHETSSGLLYDMDLIADFCNRNGILLIIDAISSFLADPLDMSALGAAAVLTGSQKALAIQPGVSIIALSPAALQRVQQNRETCMYLSLKSALKDGIRGQTPFTPAVTILLQLQVRLRHLMENGGADAERSRIMSIAQAFRANIADLPLEIVPACPSNAVTALHPVRGSAREIVDILLREYDIWVCPNGGEKADAVFRVGHIGEILQADNLLLLSALHEIHEKGVF